jgi:hypothetical protein
VLKQLLLTVRFVETLEFLLQHDHKKPTHQPRVLLDFSQLEKGAKQLRRGFQWQVALAR